jgi:hypothetical protein
MDSTNTNTNTNTVELLVLKEVLSVQNSYEKDSHILFDEPTHKYTITEDPESKYTSVTTWIHTHFPKFDANKIINTMLASRNYKEGHKYWNMTREDILAMWDKNRDEKAQQGTNLHYFIECFMNNDRIRKGYTHKELYEDYILNSTYLKPKESFELCKEWDYFIKYIQDIPGLKPYRTEWRVYDEDLKISGSIDMIYENEDGSLTIYDWKRCANITKTNNWNKYATTYCISHLPDTNFWHYAIQLNMYKYILETKYGKRVDGLYLVKLHPDDSFGSYDILEVPFLEKEMKELLDVRIKEINKAI